MRFQQGFLTVARTCSTCGGAGKVIRSPCSLCSGRGSIERHRKLTVKIPAGIASGQRLRLHGEGEHGHSGGQPGDLYVVIHVKEHEFFQRDGDDLQCAVLVSYPMLVLGGTISVPTLRDNETVHIPKSTSPDSRLRVRGKGLPHVSGRGFGDLYVTVKVEVPESLSTEQRQLIENLNKTMPTGPFKPIRLNSDEQDDRSFVDRVKDIFG